MDHWRNDTDWKTEVLGENLSQSHFAYYESHVDWPEFESRPPL
jgi:hypothetical protein